MSTSTSTPTTKTPTAAQRQQQQQEEEERGCWQKKAAYDQCFDQWYKDVFLQHKANGRVGCQREYEAYSRCFLKELDQEKHLVDSIKSVMSDDVRKRWEAQERERKAA